MKVTVSSRNGELRLSMLGRFDEAATAIVEAAAAVARADGMSLVVDARGAHPVSASMLAELRAAAGTGPDTTVIGDPGDDRLLERRSPGTRRTSGTGNSSVTVGAQVRRLLRDRP